MNYLLSKYSTFLIIILIGFTVFIIHRILRFVINLLKYFFLSYKYRVKYDKETKKYLKNHQGKPEDIIARNREAEQNLLLETRKLNQAHELQNIDKNRTIVGIAKPKGIWTKFVTEQKISWIRAMIGSKADSDSFWRNMINAQSRSQSKEQSRSR
ncbi:MAG: hypothetical protein ACO2XZ_05775 [Rickettsiales bacterium]